MRHLPGSRWAAAAIAAGSLGLFGASPAGAAIGIDETFTPGGGGCGGTFLVTGAPPGATFAAPIPGVITSWSHETAALAPRIKLKIFRPAGGANYTAVGESAVETTTPNSVHTFATRISVQAGDLVGFTLITNGSCLRSATGWEGRNTGVDPAVGTTTTFGGPFPGTQYEISALLEPDADNDGFGDETQDQCVGQVGPVNGCPESEPTDSSPPNATITKGPKDKTKKKTATFEFSSNEPGSSFQCSVDGEVPKAFAPCASPLTVKVGKGRHTFSVQATDAAGNVDPSAATDTWKVKKRRK